MRSLDTTGMELQRKVIINGYSLNHGDGDIALEMNRSPNIHCYHSLSWNVLCFQIGAEFHNSLDIHYKQNPYNENSLLVHAHQLSGVSNMISMTMCDQDIVHVQTLLRESLGQLRRRRVRIQDKWVTQERINQN